jgi:hypothetical protein
MIEDFENNVSFEMKQVVAILVSEYSLTEIRDKILPDRSSTSRRNTVIDVRDKTKRNRDRSGDFTMSFPRWRE